MSHIGLVMGGGDLQSSCPITIEAQQTKQIAKKPYNTTRMVRNQLSRQSRLIEPKSWC